MTSNIGLSNNDPANGLTPALALQSTGNLDSSAPIGLNGESVLAVQSSGTSHASANAISCSLTAAPSGASYTGGTLTRPWQGMSGNNHTMLLSTGQVISGVTVTSNSTTLSCPSTKIAGTPKAAVTIAAIA